MLGPIVTYLLKIDQEKWAAFKERLALDGHTVKWIIESLIDDYIEHGRPTPKPKARKKDKSDA